MQLANRILVVVEDHNIHAPIVPCHPARQNPGGTLGDAEPASGGATPACECVVRAPPQDKTRRAY